MKVILLKDVRGLGVRHAVKDVSDGYATNFLLPKQLAEIATPDKVAAVEAQRQAHEKELQEQERVLDTTIASAEGKHITFSVRATEKGGLFKALAVKDILHALKEQHGLVVPEATVHMEPIKTIGEHQITLHSTHKKAHCTVEVSAL